MFNETSIIKEVNIINKVICFILMLLATIICHDNIFLIFVDISLLLITKQYNKLFIFNIITTAILIINMFFPHFLWISKLFLLIIYVILLSKVTRLTELRYVIEATLYRFKNKQITYRFFYIIYFLKKFKNHFKKMLVLKDDYSMKLTPKFIFFITKQSYLKAKSSKKEFIETNDARFYNSSSNRTYIEKKGWESWDTNYLICHIIILLVTVFYGR